MNTWLWMVFYFFAILSFIPVVKLEEVKQNKTYRKLWYLSISVFMWTLILAFKFIATTPFIIYYTQLLTYPIIAVITYFIFETFQHYTHRKTSDYFHFVFIAFIITDLLIALTNPFHQLMLDIPFSQSITVESFKDASPGILFFIHAFICYIVLGVSFVRLIKYVIKDVKKTAQAFPYQLIIFSIIFGIAINVIHLFVYTFVLDPTYIFIVLISYMLYTYIYRKDFNFNLFISGKDFILDHMREMYIVLDYDERIIEYSRNLKERFPLEFIDRQYMKDFMKQMEEYVVFFTDKMEIKTNIIDSNKTYLHMEKQAFKVGTFKENGYLISLYDETVDIMYLKEIEQLRTHDLMTNLYNRNYFEEHRKRYEIQFKELGIILIDMDGLKLFNDYLGHKMGDMLIQRFARNILESTEKYKDIQVIRMGGDEFVLAIPKATQDLCESIIRDIEKRSTKKEIAHTINFSYGISIRRNPNDSLSLMMKRADKRMYENKNLKKDYKIKLEEYLKSKEIKI